MVSRPNCLFEVQMFSIFCSYLFRDLLYSMANVVLWQTTLEGCLHFPLKHRLGITIECLGWELTTSKTTLRIFFFSSATVIFCHHQNWMALPSGVHIKCITRKINITTYSKSEVKIIYKHTPLCCTVCWLIRTMWIAKTGNNPLHTKDHSTNANTLRRHVSSLTLHCIRAIATVVTRSMSQSGLYIVNILCFLFKLSNNKLLVISPVIDNTLRHINL